MNYIEVKDLYQLLIEHPDLALLDVRSAAEYYDAHVPQATLMPIDDILIHPETAVEKISQLMLNQATLYVICLSDRRSFIACHKLTEHNILNTCFVKGGTQAWIAAGYPITCGA